jgi:excisionase family DNA binding protein
MDKLLNPKELAEVIGVKCSTIYSWINRGLDIPHIKIQGSIRFRESSIKDWLEAKERAKKKRNFEL